MTRSRWLLVLLLVAAGACSGDDELPSATGVPVERTVTSTVPPAFAVVRGDYEVSWTALAATPALTYDPATDTLDPHWILNNDAEADGFALQLELYTTGFGPRWEGQEGEFRVDCTEDGHGICLFFDPDGPGPEPDLGADFGATGTIVVDRLDEDGYDLTLTDITFTSGDELTGPGGAPLHLFG